MGLPAPNRPLLQSSSSSDHDDQSWDSEPAAQVPPPAPLPDPGMDRLPAQPLTLSLDAGSSWSSEMRQLPAALPLVGPWVFSSSAKGAKAFPDTDHVVNMPVRTGSWERWTVVGLGAGKGGPLPPVMGLVGTKKRRLPSLLNGVR